MPDTFDPRGSGYDYETAKKYGITPDESGHMPSREPTTGLILKGKRHPTFDKTLAGEEKAGYRIVEKNGRLYSFPALTSDEVVDRARTQGAFIKDLARHPAYQNWTPEEIVPSFSDFLRTGTPEEKQRFFSDVGKHLPAWRGWKPDEIVQSLKTDIFFTPSPQQQPEPNLPIKAALEQSGAVNPLADTTFRQFDSIVTADATRVGETFDATKFQDFMSEKNQQKARYKTLREEIAMLSSDGDFQSKKSEAEEIHSELSKDTSWNSFVQESNTLAQIGQQEQLTNDQIREYNARVGQLQATLPQFADKIQKSERLQALMNDPNFLTKIKYEDEVIKSARETTKDIRDAVDNAERARVLKEYVVGPLKRKIDDELSRTRPPEEYPSGMLNPAGAMLGQFVPISDEAKTYRELTQAKRMVQQVEDMPISSDTWTPALDRLMQGLGTVLAPEKVPFLGDALRIAQSERLRDLRDRQISGKKLNEADQALLDAFDATEELKQIPGVQDTFYQLGQGLGGLIPYGVEFAITGGVYTAAKTIGRRQIGRILGAQAYHDLLRTAARGQLIKRLGANVVAEAAPAVFAGTVQSLANPLRILAGVEERIVPLMELTFSPAGEVINRELDKQPDSFGKAFAKQVGKDAVEYVTERMGIVVEKPVELMKRLVLGRWMQKKAMDLTNVQKALSYIRTNVGWNQMVGEVFEEVGGQPFQSWIETGEFKLMSPQEMLLTATVVGVPSLIGGATRMLDIPNRLRAERAQAERSTLAQALQEEKPEEYTNIPPPIEPTAPGTAPGTPTARSTEEEPNIPPAQGVERPAERGAGPTVPIEEVIPGELPQERLDQLKAREIEAKRKAAFQREKEKKAAPRSTFTPVENIPEVPSDPQQVREELLAAGVSEREIVNMTEGQLFRKWRDYAGLKTYTEVRDTVAAQNIGAKFTIEQAKARFAELKAIPAATTQDAIVQKQFVREEIEGFLQTPENKAILDAVGMVKGKFIAFTRDEIGQALDILAGKRKVTPAPSTSVVGGQPINLTPSEPQKKAGNYQKGHATIQGLEISIENPIGSTRSGTNIEGEKWEQEVKADYGYIRGTVGKDKDHIDVTIGGNAESQFVFVVNQKKPNGSFDEHKVVLGTTSEEEAKQVYLSNYQADWLGKQGGEIDGVAMTVDQFKDWLKTEDTTKPATVRKQPRISPGGLPKPPEPPRPKPLTPTEQRIQGVRQELDDLEKQMRDLLGGQLNMGFDPRVAAVATQMAVKYVELGIYTFKKFAEEMIQKFGQGMKPYLKQAWGGAFFASEPGIQAKMDNTDVVNKFDLETIGKEEANPLLPMAESIRDSLLTQAVLGDKRSLEILARGFEITDKNQAKEAAELGIAMAARTIARGKGSDSAKLDALIDLYKRQPSLTHRTSESIAMQQYSTPIPLGYIGGLYVRADEGAPLFEPSAGNGLLTIAADPKKVVVNEIDPVRLGNLRSQGFKAVYEEDAREQLPPALRGMNVITNPPFGNAKDRIIFDSFPLSKDDHVMSARALEIINDDQRAVLIVGGNHEWDVDGNLRNDRLFFNWLYHHYHVADVLNISGDLYAKQGAKYPIRMVLVNGRKETPAGFAPEQSAQTEKVYTDFHDIYQRMKALREEENPDVLQPETDTGRGGRGPSVPGTRRPADRPTIDTITGVPESETAGGGGRGPGTSTGTISGGTPEGGVRPPGKPARTGIRTPGITPNTDAAFGLPITPARELTRGGVDDAARSKRALQRDESLAGARVDTLDTPYIPQSLTPSLTSLTPTNMASDIFAVLDKFEDVYGSIDEYVRQQLKYNTMEELHEAFAGEQIDAIALAIANIEMGQALIIGDQTGMGKGRSAAGVIRYAIQNGIKPVFFTQNGRLYSDLYRDLIDIGFGHIKPFVLNSGVNIVDDSGGILHKAISTPEHSRVVATKDLTGYDLVLTSYSQIQNEEYWKKREFLSEVAQGTIMILDESHTASGIDSNTGLYMTNLVQNARGVTFLSATFAKRPDNIPIYAVKTAMREANASMMELIEAIVHGGVAMQEVISAELTAAGQMMRRQQSFDGITIERVVLDDKKEEHTRISDMVTDIIRDIIGFQSVHVGAVIEMLKKRVKAEAKQVAMTQGTRAAGVDNVPFASKVHNVIEQLMFALKVEEVAKETIAAAKRGQKPVILFRNTMAAFLENLGYELDDAIPDTDFSRVLDKALLGVMRYTVRAPNGQQTRHQLKREDLGREGAEAFDTIREKIKEASTGITISPIDILVQRLEATGLRVGEVTGRKRRIDFSGTEPRLANRKEHDSRATFRKFNHGELDVILINASGGTGTSAHSSVKFKDQRQRLGIIFQPKLDINEEIQGRGRINRVGQVVLPQYEYISTAIPAELRMMMMLKKKMKSLDANTTSKQRSALSMEMTDFMNKYGDQVVTEYVKENLDFNDSIGDPLKLRDMDEEQLVKFKRGEDAARRVTGRVAILPVSEQERFYQEITRRYEDYIDYLNSIDENDLELKSLDLKAKTLTSFIAAAGKGGQTSFGSDTTLETISAQILRKPMKRAEVLKLVQQSAGDKSGGEIRQQLRSDFEEFWKGHTERELARYMPKSSTESNDDRAKRLDRRQRAVQKLENHQRRMQDLFDDFQVGQIYRIPLMLDDPQSPPSLAAFIGFKIAKAAKNPYAPSNVVLRFVVNDHRRQISIPASEADALNAIRVETSRKTPIQRKDEFEKWDTSSYARDRETRTILTGNVLQGMTLDIASHGKLVSYTTDMGDVKRGILLPHNVQTTKLEEVRLPISQALDYIMEHRIGYEIDTNNGIQFEKTRQSEFIMRVAKSKAAGGIYYLDKDVQGLVKNGRFDSVGDSMVGFVPEANMRKMLNLLENKFNDSMMVPEEFAQKAQQKKPPQGPRAGDELAGNLYSIGPAIVRAWDRMIRPWTERIFIGIMRVVNKLPESVRKYLRASFAQTPEIRAAFETFRQMVGGGRITVNKMTRMILHGDATEEEYKALDRMLRGHPDDFNTLPDEFRAAWNPLFDEYHAIAQELTSEMGALGLPIREEWKEGPSHWYPNMWKQYFPRMVLGRLFGFGRPNFRIRGAEAAHTLPRITDKWVVLTPDGSIATTPGTKQQAIFDEEDQADAFVEKNGGYRVTYVDKDSGKLVEEKFDSYGEREKLVQQLYQDATASRIEKKKPQRYTIMAPMTLEQMIGHGLLEDPIINVRRGIREAVGLVAKTGFFTKLGQVAASDEADATHNVQLKDYNFKLPPNIAHANDDIERLMNGYIPKSLAEDLVALYGQRGLVRQMYDMITHGLKAGFTVYNPFRYLKQPIENELSLFFADSVLWLNKVSQAQVFKEYMDTVVGSTPNERYDLFVKLGGDKEDFWTAELRRYGRDLSRFRDVEGVSSVLSLAERMEKYLEQNRMYNFLADKADLARAIYHHEDIIYRYYAFVGWMKQGMTPREAMSRVQNSFFYAKEAPKWVTKVSRHIPFIVRVNYEFARIMAARLRDYPVSTVMKIGLMLIMYDWLRDMLAEKAGWDLKELDKRANKEGPKWWELVLPITDDRGRNIIVNLTWLIPFAELGFFAWDDSKDVTKNALRLTPLAFKGALTTAFGKTAYGTDITKPGDPDWLKKYVTNGVVQYMPFMMGQYLVNQYRNAVEPDKDRKVPWWQRAFVAPAIGGIRRTTQREIVVRSQFPALDKLKYLLDEKAKLTSKIDLVLNMDEVLRHNKKAMQALKDISKDYNMPITSKMIKWYTIRPSVALRSARRRQKRQMEETPLESRAGIRMMVPGAPARRDTVQ